MLLKYLWPFRKKKVKRINDIVKYSVPERVYTPVNQLAIGMYVIELDRPWLDSPFLFQGFEIKNENEIMQLKDCCNFVYIDTTRDRKRRPHKLDKTEPPIIDTNIDFGPPPPKLSRFDKEIDNAEIVHKRVDELVSDIMEHIARGEGVDTKTAKAAVAECVNSILHSPDAFLWLNQLKNKDEYTAQHSLNVCVLSIVLGRHINFSIENLNNVGLCGMMHDMGKMLVPLHILNKPGKLEPDEMVIMRSHASLGYELLKSSQDMYRGAIDSAHSHHETLDGKGYPNKLNHKQLPLFTRVVTIADMYDAITSDRVYQKGRTHLEATAIMSDLCGTQLDGNLVVKFIEALGVYPPGCVVAMTNGSIAIVVEVNELVRLRPKIIILLDQGLQPVPEKIINLADMELDEQGNLLTIRGIIKAQDYHIDIAKYYQQGVLQKGFAHSKS
ncbi:MAG: HD-GYP domain-containing protein [Methylomonas sp.]|jgi:HD-GYP domain-containing protein (c-di-GMP phosphodiesterase class II)|uniref:HD-GYP domain-containing protein n=1 Tax=Methylomonas sp. TaxID=418 RepID=UPI0025DD5802|nr:HD-GYP domain-containing protein [Methylomonas sp.]MCK9608266.1 HD-GYP domain-containing protein [Methylomonas sp.]